MSGQNGPPRDTSWWHEASAPRRVENGITARSKRGAIGEQWWSRRFVEVLESFGMSGRLARGRNYARRGQVMEFELGTGKVRARVQGSRPAPYQVRIGVMPLTTAQWRSVTEALGPIDILITNTGGPPPRPDPLSHPREEWERAHRTLVLAPLELIGAVMPGMRERGWGRIVNIGSWTVREPLPNLMLSNSHRSATFAAFKTIARDVAASGVTLNTVLPGRIGTDRLYALSGGKEQAEAIGRSEVPTGRLGTPREMAAAVAFLCSKRASYITGVGLLVDVGLSRLT